MFLLVLFLTAGALMLVGSAGQVSAEPDEAASLVLGKGGNSADAAVGASSPSQGGEGSGPNQVPHFRYGCVPGPGSC